MKKLLNKLELQAKNSADGIIYHGDILIEYIGNRKLMYKYYFGDLKMSRNEIEKLLSNRALNYVQYV